MNSVRMKRSEHRLREDPCTILGDMAPVACDMPDPLLLNPGSHCPRVKRRSNNNNGEEPTEEFGQGNGRPWAFLQSPMESEPSQGTASVLLPTDLSPNDF